jgi:hypothetical protein
VPVGIIGLGLAVWLIPVLPVQRHRFDVIGVVLSGIALFLDRVRVAGSPIP